MTIEEIQLLFSKMSILYSRQLPSDQNLMNIIKNEYYNHLKDVEVETVALNYKRHVKESNYLPTIADLSKPIKPLQQERYYIPTAKETRLMIEQKEQELTNQKVDREFIRKQVKETLEKLEGIKREQYKRDFNPFNE